MKNLSIVLFMVILATQKNPVLAQTEPYDFFETTATSLTGNVQTWLDEFDPYRINFEAVPEYPKADIPKQVMWEYPNLREGDVSWMTRYERIIDTRQKMNIVLRYPKLSVFDLMLKLALQSDGPKMYSDRDFKQELSDQEMKDRLTYVEYVDVPDTINGGTMTVPVKGAVPFESLVKLQIMEDWVFDNVQSRMYPRIVGIAIVYRPVVAGGSVELNEQPLFWMKYNDIRPFFVNAEVFNKNLAHRISMDHYFQARMFDSQIIKEPNVMDAPLKYYPEFEDNGLAALLKSEEIKNDLFVMEHDLWEY